MYVKFSSPKRIAGNFYPVGVHSMPDKIAYHQDFKTLVKSGHVVVIPRDEAAQKMQAHKDAHAAHKAMKASMNSKAEKLVVAPTAAPVFVSKKKS